MTTRTLDHLALYGGSPVRTSLLPYGRQSVSAQDIAAVEAVLTSDWLTTGPQVPAFETEFAEFCGSLEAVAVSNGTAALHTALAALNIGPGDEVIVPALTFAASANAVLYCRATPVFADIDPETLLLDPESVAQKLSPRTKAILSVDYAGQPCDYTHLRQVAGDRWLLADGCHAPGARWGDRQVGQLADLTTFSFHPVKHLTTGEGGMIASTRPEWTSFMRSFRNHGIVTDHRQREEAGTWFYEMQHLGYNYRLSDLQCALGRSQLRQLPAWLEQRRAIAAHYDQVLAGQDLCRPQRTQPEALHAYHLYVIQLNLDALSVDRQTVFQALRAEGIGVNVHYVPVHLHPYYRSRLQTGPGLCPVAESAYEGLLSLPVFPQMRAEDANDVMNALSKVLQAFQR